MALFSFIVTHERGLEKILYDLEQKIPGRASPEILGKLQLFIPSFVFFIVKPKNIC